MSSRGHPPSVPVVLLLIVDRRAPDDVEADDWCRRPRLGRPEAPVERRRFRRRLDGPEPDRATVRDGFVETAVLAELSGCTRGSGDRSVRLPLSGAGKAPGPRLLRAAGCGWAEGTTPVDPDTRS